MLRAQHPPRAQPAGTVGARPRFPAGSLRSCPSWEPVCVDCSSAYVCPPCLPKLVPCLVCSQPHLAPQLLSQPAETLVGDQEGRRELKPFLPSVSPGHCLSVAASPPRCQLLSGGSPIPAGISLLRPGGGFPPLPLSCLPFSAVVTRVTLPG